MSSEPRLRDGGSSFERGLLASASRDRMSPAARRALLATVTAATATAAATAVASTGAGAAAAAAKPGFAAMIAGLPAVVKVSVVVALTSVAAMSAALVALPGAPARTTPVARVASVASAAPAPAAPLDLDRTDRDADTEKPISDIQESSDSNPKSRKPNAKGSKQAVEDVSIADEMKLVDEARSRLAAGDARGALRAVDVYRGRFPKGKFAEQAAVLRIEGHARLGDAEARTLARAFLARHPTGPYTQRVQRVISQFETKENKK
ncbi:hypothetical protein EON77_16320 [bacterium]|nr:MAG: hypothetical protein EON77_16320 [bacterium]